MLVKYCVSWVLRISNSLPYLVSLRDVGVFVMKRVVDCSPVFCSWAGLCSWDVANIERVSAHIIWLVFLSWASARDVFDVKIISHKFYRRWWLYLK